MKIFVVSWFYPPVTTSEALVTYKLLSNSKNEYYLCSASSKKWSYGNETKMKSKNVKQYIIDTEDFDEFISKTVEKYMELSKKIKFDAIMTRSMPPESQKAGFIIKKIDKNIPWIVSLADPIANNPYETFYCLANNRFRIIRNLYFNVPNFCIKTMCRFSRNKYTRNLVYLNNFEKKIIKKADIVIVPTEEQGRHIMYFGNYYKEKCMVVPHSYDLKLYPKVSNHKNDKYTFAFIGHSDDLRSVEPIIRGVKLIKDINPEVAKKIKIRLIGNIPNKIKNMIYVYFLNDIISVEGTCDYYESLKIMKQSDCLIHIDADFPMLKNGSIFFAAKIVDYLGAGKPIFGITNPQCPAGKIICDTGGICCSKKPIDVATTIVSILNNPLHLIKKSAEKYNVVNVAKNYDEELERRIKHEKNNK